VSCFGNFAERITDDNDYWLIQSDTEFVQARISKIKLQHTKTGLFLGVKKEVSKKEKGRNEVCTSVEGKVSQRVFFFEDNRIDGYYKNNIKDEKIDETVENYLKIGFWEMFVEYHKKMIEDEVKDEVNDEIEKKIEYSSNVWEWPFMKKGILYYISKNRNDKSDNGNSNDKKYNDKSNEKKKIIFLSGNTVNWKISLLIFIFPFIVMINRACKIRDRKFIEFPFMVNYCLSLFLLNFIPYFLVTKETYIHNYFISFYYALILSLHLISKLGNKVLFLLLTISFSCYLHRYNLLGKEMNLEKCKNLGLEDVCMTFE